MHWEYVLYTQVHELGRSTSKTEKIYKEKLYRHTGTTTTKKIDALKNAVNLFIDSVAKHDQTDATANAVGHKISIIKYAGEKTDTIGDGMYSEDGYRYNYTQTVAALTEVKTTDNVNNLKQAVNKLRPAGATSVDFGLELAQKQLEADKDNDERGKVVIVFTDGSPTHSRGFQNDVAASAINTAGDLEGNYKAKVYAIGVFGGNEIGRAHV